MTSRLIHACENTLFQYVNVLSNVNISAHEYIFHQKISFASNHMVFQKRGIA